MRAASAQISANSNEIGLVASVFSLHRKYFGIPPPPPQSAPHARHYGHLRPPIRHFCNRTAYNFLLSSPSLVHACLFTATPSLLHSQTREPLILSHPWTLLTHTAALYASLSSTPQMLWHRSISKPQLPSATRAMPVPGLHTSTSSSGPQESHATQNPYPPPM